MKILLAVDGSKYSLRAVKFLVEHADWYRNAPKVDLVHVHLRVPSFRGMSKVISKSDIERYYREEGEAALVEAKKILDAAAVRRAHSSWADCRNCYKVRRDDALRLHTDRHTR